MDYETYSYRNGEVILNANYQLKKEIEETLNSLEVTHGQRKDRLGIKDPHELIKESFVEKGWEDEYLVTPTAKEKKERFDLYKDKIAGEIEFSRKEFLYRDYLRFVTAFNEDRIIAGVLITLTKDAKENYKYKSVRPDIDYVKEDLEILKSAVTVPIWVIGIH